MDTSRLAWSLLGAALMHAIPTLLVLAAGCSSASMIHDDEVADARAPSIDAPQPSADTLAAKHPGDIGMGSDPDVVFFADFEDATIDDVFAKFSSSYRLNAAGMHLDADVPAASPGHQSLAMSTDPDHVSTALYKLFPEDYDELYVRWYIKYPAGGAWHHTGVWWGGYADRLEYASPHAGERPVGDDRISISVEPNETVNGSTGANPRLDTYMYWMKMRAGGDGLYWGNATIRKSGFVTDDDQWMCIETHVKLNSDVSSSAGAELDVWKNDVLVQHADASGPLGTWLWGAFCPQGSDEYACTHYAPTEPAVVPLDLQWRKSTNLKLNYIWPQNDTRIGNSTLYFDHITVAKRRIGCITAR